MLASLRTSRRPSIERPCANRNRRGDAGTPHCVTIWKSGAGMTALVLDRVVKRFGDFTAVNDLSFSVPEGGVFGFLGGNGAGKTTTIRMSLDILRPTSGK